MSRRTQDIHQHNLEQKRYFESSLKTTMLPSGSSYICRQVDEVVHILGLSREERVIEVGCGMGRYTLELWERGYQVEGLDLSPVLLERLRGFAGSRHEYPLYCADIIDFPPELEGEFEAVIGFFTLHHLHNLADSFSAMIQLLKPGGRLVFLEPNAYNPLYYLQILFSPKISWQGDKGVTSMRRSVVFPAMQKAGLRNLRLVRFGFFPPFLANLNWGARLEQVLERVNIWRPLLPFQLFYGERN